jgi:uncharacterized protein
MLASADEILGYVDEVAAQFRPQQIVLFGSSAYGQPNFDSDVDILVISSKHQSRTAQALKIRQAISAPFPLDLIVRSRPEIERRIGWNDYFLAEIMQKGLTLYDADDPRMAEQGRRRLRRRFAVAAVA